MALCVRAATPADREAIRAVERAAFPTAAEADLVDALERDGDVTLSLVVEVGGEVVGHLLCSRMVADADGQALDAWALGPIAVRPERQGEGMGGAMTWEAIARAEAAGAQIMFVLGEPDYYGRFGFRAEAAAPFDSPYAGPYWMARWLGEPTEVRSGRARHAGAFARL